MTEDTLRAHFPAMIRIIQIARGAVRQLRQHTIDTDVATELETRRAESPALALLLRHPEERARLVRQVQGDVVTARRHAAGVAIHPLRSVVAWVEDWRTLILNYRRDPARSPAFARAYDHVDANGMIGLAIYKLQRQAMLAQAPVSEWRIAYMEAFARADAVGLTDAAIIERLARGPVTLKDESDRGTLTHLRELISWSEDERVPDDVPDFEAVAADVDRLLQRAAAAQVTVIDPEHHEDAAAAYRAQESTLLEAGATSDRDDLQALVQPAATAAGE
jgi:hypothetical protein